MSVYNGERFLREAVESVRTQTLADFELIAVDDGSTDSSPEILAKLASKDPRIVVHHQTNQGAGVARNCGFNLARARFIAILDADDVAAPTRLERQWRFLADHDAVAVVGGAVMFMDDSSRPFAHWQYPLTDAEIRRAFDSTTPLLQSAVMLRKCAFDRVGGYRALFREAEDLDLWLRIAEHYELVNLPDVVVRYRVHAEQATLRHLKLQTLCSVAARLAARERAAARPDPLSAIERIDQETLLALGATGTEITTALVHATTWLARTMGRAGYEDACEQLFREAGVKARSESGSPMLIAHVHRERARRRREQKQRVRALVETARAVRAERKRHA
jgi:hypothetical protein